MILGNKSDLEEQKAISSEQGKTFADSKDMLFFETSAKTAEKVEEAFHSLSRILVEKKKKENSEKKEKLNSIGVKTSNEYSQENKDTPQKLELDPSKNSQNQERKPQTNCHECWK